MLILFFPTWSLTPMEEHDWGTKCCGEYMELRNRKWMKIM